MTYSTNVPQSGQSLGQTQPTILANFNTIQQGVSVNHVALGAADMGKHKFLQMPTQATPPSPAITTSATEGAFYTQTQSVAGLPAASFVNLTYQAQSNGNKYILTSVDEGNFSTFATNTSLYAGVIASITTYSGGWTFLPGSLLLQYVKYTASGGAILPFPKRFSAVPYSITGSYGGTPTAISFLTLTTTGYVIAIGPA